MTVLLSAASALALVAVGAPTVADPMAVRFGAREAVISMSLAPDGKSIAYLSALEGAGTALFVAKLTAGATPQPILTSTGNPDRLTQCNWSTSNRLVCQIYMITDTGFGYSGYTRMVAIDADGGNVKELSRASSHPCTPCRTAATSSTGPAMATGPS